MSHSYNYDKHVKSVNHMVYLTLVYAPDDEVLDDKCKLLNETQPGLIR